MRRYWIGSLSLGGVLGLLALAILAWRSRASQPPAPHQTPAPLARAPRVYHEKLEGSRYVNQDLGLSIATPDDWTPSIGKRSEELPPYEGLVLKMESRREPDPETQMRPLVSVFKKTLGAGAPQDPIGYIRANLLTAPKKVLDPPKLATIHGHSVGCVSYEMPAAHGTLKVRQVVRIVNTEAIIVTAFIPAGSFEEFSAVLDKLFGSIDWSS